MFRRERRGRTLVATLGSAWPLLVLLSCLLPLSIGHAASPFSVVDSIQRVVFVNPTLWSVNGERYVEPLRSKNGDYVIFVTERGILSSNVIEATIWIYDKDQLRTLSRSPRAQVKPRALVRMSGSSNAPIISDVRWLGDSKSIAFIGRNGGPIANLYTADAETGALVQRSPGSASVTAFDIVDDTIAYTTLAEVKQRPRPSELESVSGKGGIYDLLYPRGRESSDADESTLIARRNALHVTRHGKEVVLIASGDDGPQVLYAPVLAVSPDGRYLIATTPVKSIPSSWESYVFGQAGLKSAWRSADPWDTADDNPWKAQAYTLFDLDTAQSYRLIDAPAGPGTFLFRYVATKILWSKDSRRVLLSNVTAKSENDRTTDRGPRSVTPAMAIVDVVSRNTEMVPYLERLANERKYVSEVSWDESKSEIVLHLVSRATGKPIEAVRYVRSGNGWKMVSAVPSISEPCGSSPAAMEIREDLNHSASLWLQGCGQARKIWEPNPELGRVSMGSASLFSWNDQKKRAWTGVLVTPDKSSDGRGIPLVIQTHGYEAGKFFADGIYTTGSGGRAFASHGIAVLQVREPTDHMDSPEEGPELMDMLSSAIGSLNARGIVDQERIGIIGFSYTCFETLYALTHRPDLFAVASITDGNNKGLLVYLFDVDIGGKDSPFLKPIEDTWGGLPYGASAEKWLRDTPSLNLQKVVAPLEIWALERGALMGQWDIYAGLRALHRPVEMYWISSQRFLPHVLVKPEDRYVSQQGAVDWFRFWLQGYERTVPNTDTEETAQSLAVQYGRWEKLCDMQTETNPDRPTFCVGTKH
jgi:hypothetical protein